MEVLNPDWSPVQPVLRTMTPEPEERPWRGGRETLSHHSSSDPYFYHIHSLYKQFRTWAEATRNGTPKPRATSKGLPFFLVTKNYHINLKSAWLVQDHPKMLIYKELYSLNPLFFLQFTWTLIWELEFFLMIYKIKTYVSLRSLMESSKDRVI